MLNAAINVLGIQYGDGTTLNQVTVSVSVSGTDTTLPVGNVAGTVDWGDGSPMYVVNPAPWAGDITLPAHAYQTGTFLVKFSVHDYSSPVQNMATAVAQLEFVQAQSAMAVTPIIIGPILPADSGYPNSSQWNFNIGTDVQVLASSVKMILIVEPGERKMMPEYGCALRRSLFDTNGDEVDHDISDEITRAITTWEPRVVIQGIDCTRSGRKLSVTLTLASKLNQERFQLNIELER